MRRAQLPLSAKRRHTLPTPHLFGNQSAPLRPFISASFSLRHRATLLCDDRLPQDAVHVALTFKRRVREITRRAKGVSIEMTMAELAPYMRGWRSYSDFCETPQELVNLTRWVRLPLRVALWRQWKTQRRRQAAVLELRRRRPLTRPTATS